MSESKQEKRKRRRVAAEKKRLDRDDAAYRATRVTEGSIGQSVYLDEMMERMMHYNADFVTYSKNMEIYLDRQKLEKSMVKRNYDYCRNVIDLCVHPLAHGVNSETVLQSIGTYIGMSLVNPELRKQCNDHVVSALYPGVAKLSRSVEPVLDRQRETMARRVTFLESKLGHELPFGLGQKLREMPSLASTHNERMMDMHDRVMKVRNYGRVPLTPETAALMRLNFAAQYYYAIRDPSANAAELAKQYRAAQTTLNGLAERDGISEAEINQNARLLVGQFSSVPGHDDLSVMFEDVAHGEVHRGEGQETETPKGDKETVWRGEYVTADGNAFDDWFSVREPKTRKEMLKYMSDYYADVYSACGTFSDVARVWSSPEFQSSCELFKQMMADDGVCAATKNRDFKSADDLLSEAQRSAGEEWARAHPECAQELADLLNKWREDAQRKQERDFGFDFDDFDGGGSEREWGT